MHRFPIMFALGLLVAVSGIVPPASADYGRLLDPEGDTEGRLDMSDMIYSHRNRGGVKRFSHALFTHRRWKPRMLDRDRRMIHLLFDTRPNVGYQDYSFVTERRLEIFFRRGRLRAKMYNNLGDPPKFIANVRVRRSAPKGVWVVIPRRVLSRRRLPHYEWAFMTQFARKGHKECPLNDPCFDRMGRYVRHDL